METNTVKTLENDNAIKTLHELFIERVRRTPQTLAYRYYDAVNDTWLDLKWGEVAERVKKFAHLLNEHGTVAGDRCAILQENSPEWVCVDQACLAQKLITVPLFYNDRVENTAHVITDAGVRFLAIGTTELWEPLKPLFQGSCLEKVILISTLEIIWENPDPQNPQAVEFPDDLATIIYTSGTTGNPKGVMLTHTNILSNAKAANHASNVYPSDLFLSFLPLSHAFERTVGYCLPMMMGASVGFARSILTLQEDFLTIKPSIIVTVPRMFEKINARFSAKLSAAPASKQKLVSLAESVGYHHFEKVQGRAAWQFKDVLYPLLDKMVGQKVRDSLGGRLRIAVSGGAPLASSIAKRFLGFGIPIIQGYGLTECSPVVSSNRLNSNDPESVGHPLIGVEVATDAKTSELMVRGEGIMLGYWQQPDATAEVIDENQWFHTGDLATIKDNRIYITGRIKDILVLSNGEKVPPTDVEEAIAQDTWVDQVMVVGEGRPFLVALIVPSAFAARADKATFLARVAKDLHAFPGYEKIKDIVFCPEPWTVEQSLLTPTMKLRRKQILDVYAQDLEDIYNQASLLSG